MGAATVALTGQTPLGSGYKIVIGTVTGPTSYDAGGSYMNLASYFKSTSSPIVTFTGPTNNSSTDFYTPAHNRGTATAGKIRYVQSGAAVYGPQYECNASKELSNVVVGFIAIGEQF